MKDNVISPSDIDVAAPHNLPYMARTPINKASVTFCQGYATEFIRRAATRPGPRECYILPELRAGEPEVADFLSELYTELPSVLNASTAPEGKLGDYGQSYGNISPLLTFMGWPSSPAGTSVPNGAAYARERVVAAKNKYTEPLNKAGLKHVVAAREAYLNTGELAGDSVRVFSDRLKWLTQFIEPASHLSVRRDTNAGAPTLLSSPIYKQAVLELALSNNLKAHHWLLAGDLAEAAAMGVVVMYIQGFRYQNDGAKKGETPVQDVILPDDLHARNRMVLSLWLDRMVIANKMSPNERLAAERCRTVQAQAFPSGFVLQVLADWGAQLRYKIPAMEFQDAKVEMEARINALGIWTLLSVMATGDLTGADNCHPVELMSLCADIFFGAIGDNASRLATILGFGPSAVFSDEMAKAGGFLNGHPLDKGSFGQIFSLASGKGTTALEVIIYTLLYLEDALILLFSECEDKFTSDEFTDLIMGRHKKYTLTIKGDGWAMTVHEPSGSRKAIESELHWTLPAAMRYMEGGYTRDLGGYEFYVDNKSVKVTNSATAWVNKISLGDKTFDPMRRPHGQFGWKAALGIYSSHPLIEGEEDSVLVRKYDEVGKRVLGFSPTRRILDSILVPDDNLGLTPAAAMVREDPSRVVWDPRFMTPEWREKAKDYFVEVPAGLLSATNDLLTSTSTSSQFSDDIRQRMITTWRSTFVAMRGKEDAGSGIFSMTRRQIGDILTAHARQDINDGDAVSDLSVPNEI